METDVAPPIPPPPSVMLERLISGKSFRSSRMTSQMSAVERSRNSILPKFIRKVMR